MLINSLLTLIYTILSTLLVFNLPALPDTVLTIAEQVTSAFVTGIDILRVFVGNTCMATLALLFELVIALNAAYMLYSLVMWVLRKIPLFGIKE